MRLEGEAANCFSTRFVLKLDDRPFGKFEGRWFGESLDVQLLERRKLIFRKKGAFTSEFDLVDTEGDKVLGRARRSGFFTSAWDLFLGAGEVKLVKVGWFGSSYQVTGNGEVLATVHRLGACSQSWEVESSAPLSDTDLLLIGLVFQVIQRRQAQQAAAATPHGS
jgi:hypothetical protein